MIQLQLEIFKGNPDTRWEGEMLFQKVVGPLGLTVRLFRDPDPYETPWSDG